MLLDRFVDSSLAYQGGGRELGVGAVRAVNLLATRGLQADRTLLLTISPAAGRARLRERALAPDRLEREDADFFQRIADTYAQLARSEPQRIRCIDAEQTPERVLGDALLASRTCWRPPRGDAGSRHIGAAAWNRRRLR